MNQTGTTTISANATKRREKWRKSQQQQQLEDARQATIFGLPQPADRDERTRLERLRHERYMTERDARGD